MQLKTRLKKLEQSRSSADKHPIVFRSFVKIRGGTRDENGCLMLDKCLKIAQIGGTDLGIIQRNENETEDAFVRRVYAIKASGKQVESINAKETSAA